MQNLRHPYSRSAKYFMASFCSFLFVQKYMLWPFSQTFQEISIFQIFSPLFVRQFRIDVNIGRNLEPKQLALYFGILRTVVSS